MHIRESSFWTPQALGGVESYQRIRQGLRLQPVPGGYAALHLESDDGARSTWLTPDPDYVRAILDVQRDMRSGAVAYESLVGIALAQEKFTVKRPGWPDEWMRGNVLGGCSTGGGMLRPAPSC